MFCSEPAARSIAARDGGTSSAMFAVMTAAALSVRHRRPCRVVLSLLGLFLVLTAVIYQRVLDAQHLGAAFVGIVFWWPFGLGPFLQCFRPRYAGRPRTSQRG
jgi:hypothetical protein